MNKIDIKRIIVILLILIVIAIILLLILYTNSQNSKEKNNDSTTTTLITSYPIEDERHVALFESGSNRYLASVDTNGNELDKLSGEEFVLDFKVDKKNFLIIYTATELNLDSPGTGNIGIYQTTLGGDSKNLIMTDSTNVSFSIGPFTENVAYTTPTALYTFDLTSNNPRLLNEFSEQIEGTSLVAPEPFWNNAGNGISLVIINKDGGKDSLTVEL